MKVVNFWAGPGSGKSTTAAGVFCLLKLHGVNCELVTEYAKDLTWRAGSPTKLKNQLQILGEQVDRLNRLQGKVDVAVTDSPLPLGIIYCDEADREAMSKLAWRYFNQFDNLNYYVRRVKKYSSIGRYQTEEEARQADSKVFGLCYDNLPLLGNDMRTIDGDWKAIGTVAGEILRLFNMIPEYGIAPLLGCL